MTSLVELLSEEVLVVVIFGAVELLLVPGEIFELPDEAAPPVRLGRETELSPLSKAFKGNADGSVRLKTIFN